MSGPLAPEGREAHRPGLNTALEALQTAIPPVSHALPWWTEVSPRILQPELTRLLRGELSAKAFIEQVAPAMDAAIKAQP